MAEPTGDALATRASMLQRLCDLQDAKSWSTFVDLYSPFLQQVLRRAGVPDQDAGDLVQETFLAVANHIGDFEHDAARGRFRGWLVRIALNKRRQYLRTIRRRGAACGGTTNLELLGEVPGAILEEEWHNRRMSAALERTRSEVSESLWQAFELTVLWGMSSNEAAKVLGVNRGCLDVRKARVKKVLLRVLEEIHE